MERTQEEKLIGGLTHIAVLFSWWGFIANIVLYILYRPKSQFAARHVKQALGLQVVVLVIGYLLATLFGVSLLGMGVGMHLAGVIGSVVVGLLILGLFWIGALVLVILGAIHGFQGKEYRHPLIGAFVEKLAE
ncbi:MAG: DUF4870 domain-containing protein [Mycobacterium leprae]